MDTTITALRQAIEMARANAGDAEYVRRRLDEITWGVDALVAVVEAARAFMQVYEAWDKPMSGWEKAEVSALRDALAKLAGEGEPPPG